jgi:hypothetical protein
MAAVGFTDEVRAEIRRMSTAMGNVRDAEVVRRGLILLDFHLSLSDDEELVVRNKESGKLERVSFRWDA